MARERRPYVVIDLVGLSLLGWAFVLLGIAMLMRCAPPAGLQ